MDLKYLNQYPNFKEIVSKVVETSHLQKKKIINFHKKVDNSYFNKAEKFSLNFKNYLSSQQANIEIATKAYLKMCADMMISHLYFYKYNKYPLDDQKSAFEKVYDNVSEMKSYVYGIALSQFLWPTHYSMYSFFQNEIKKKELEIDNYLEIGCGHGLFLLEAINRFEDKINYEIVDISKTSIDITKSIIDFNVKKKLNIQYKLQDVLKYETKKKFDFIEMGEVLEHVDLPGKLLKKIKNLLEDDGKIFLSTCVDCPTIDHVYHFKSVKEIEDLIRSSGLNIKNRMVLPVEDLPMTEIIKRKITINYCALLSKK
jgi:SAM-dependent methyltransferase